MPKPFKHSMQGMDRVEPLIHTIAPDRQDLAQHASNFGKNCALAFLAFIVISITVMTIKTSMMDEIELIYYRIGSNTQDNIPVYIHPRGLAALPAWSAAMNAPSIAPRFAPPISGAYAVVGSRTTDPLAPCSQINTSKRYLLLSAANPSEERSYEN